MSETMQQVITAITENRERFRAFCMSLSDEEAMRAVPDSTWVVKDFAAHLATLDTTLVRYLESVIEGGQINMKQTATGDPFDLDEWNNEQVAERRDWSMQRVFDEAAVNRARLIETLQRMTDEQIDRNMHFSDPKRGSADFPLKAFLVGWTQHDPIHAADMLKALPERAADPELAAWLANPFVTSYQTAMKGS